MRAQTNRHRFAPWLATTISISLLAIWIAAGFRTNLSSGGFFMNNPHRDFALSAGCLHWFEPEPLSPDIRVHDSYYIVGSATPPTFNPGLILPKTQYVPGLGRITLIPLWLPFLLYAIPTALLWRRNRRPGPDDCQNCGYNMTGNVSGKCPECGTPLKSAASPAPPPELFV